MSQDQLSLLEARPGRAQIRACLAIGAGLAVAYLVTLPFAAVRLVRLDAFIPMADTLLLVADLITATLLLSQGAVFRSRALIALAGGYVFTGLIVISHALTFPGAFSPTGLLGAGLDTTVWIYFFWRAGFVLAVILYVLFRRADARRADALERPSLAIAASTGIAFALVVAVTVLTTAGQAWLPRMMQDPLNWNPDRTFAVQSGLIGLAAIAMVLTWRQQRSLLDIWLMLALWAWIIQMLLVVGYSGRFSVAWYAGRFAGLFSHLVVMLALLAETNRIYARLALTEMVRKREREARLLSMDAVAASIAHEVRQPLHAIVTQAAAGLQWLARTPAEIGEAAASLKAISREGHRVGDVITSIRGMFAQRSGGRAAVDLNHLIRDSVQLVSAEIAAGRVALRLELDETLPLVIADRVQVQQVFLNLFTNAIDAMSQHGRPLRQLSVRSSLSNGVVLVEVADSGAGIEEADLDRVFDTFFTTKATGSGLGLSICRSIVEAHGGRLWASRQSPGGATFHLQLPHGQGTA